VEQVIDQIRYGTFSARTQSGEPDDTAFITVEGFTFLPGYGVFVPMNFYCGHFN
jgi:hypothetical protein